MPNPIQEQFGSRVIEAFAEFARADLPTTDDHEQKTFDFVTDGNLRRNLAEVFYGVRWIYKLGLALLTRDEERAAHVRAQIVDYASIAEGLLSYCLAHAIYKGHTSGARYQWHDPLKQQRQINWNQQSPEQQMARQSFWWMIQIASDFGVIDAPLQRDLDWLRTQRNTVHLRARSSLGKTAFLNQSKRAFQSVSKTIVQARRWIAAHP